MMKKASYDICIVGGGLVGMALALMLAKQALRVVMVESKVSVENENPDHSKALALTYATQAVLQDLAIWPKIAAVAAMITTVHVSEQGRFARCILSAKEMNLPFLGQLVPEALLNKAMLTTVLKQPNIVFFRPATLRSLNHEARQIVIKRVGSDELIQLNYRLLIAADGADSTIRTALNITVNEMDYAQSALVSRVLISQDHQQVAYERFTKLGTIALLPVAKQRCALIISGNNEVIAAWKKLTVLEFLQQLQTLFGFRLGRFSGLSQPMIFPLRGLFVDEQIKPGFLLMGNAAHLIHPVAAQGFNLSMLDIAALDEVITQTRQEKKDFTTFEVLQCYQKLRRDEQQRIIKATNGIVNLFSSDLLSLQFARHLGLIGLEYLAPLKALFTKQAIGLGGRVTKSIRKFCS